ncbi:MAG: hypothetical protein IKW77_01760 [Salinivirgaceae bacterium]|nr:hypothetical protein [Salinivirgaceae bacterium]
MKHLLFCLAILLCSNAVQGQSSDGGIFKYRVISITEYVIENDEAHKGEATFPTDGRTIVVTEDDITINSEKSNIKELFYIKDWGFEDGNLIYVTRHSLSNDKVMILVQRFDDGIFTFSFKNLNTNECYIYRVEYFE